MHLSGIHTTTKVMVREPINNAAIQLFFKDIRKIIFEQTIFVQAVRYIIHKVDVMTFGNLFWGQLSAALVHTLHPLDGRLFGRHHQGGSVDWPSHQYLIALFVGMPALASNKISIVSGKDGKEGYDFWGCTGWPKCRESI